MAHIVKYELSNGTLIAAEVTPEADFQPDRVPTIDFKQVRQAIEGIGEELGDTLKKIAPSSGTIEFGLELSGEAGVPLFARGTTTAHMTVTLEWSGAAAG